MTITRKGFIASLLGGIAAFFGVKAQAHVVGANGPEYATKVFFPDLVRKSPLFPAEFRSPGLEIGKVSLYEKGDSGWCFLEEDTLVAMRDGKGAIELAAFNGNGHRVPIRFKNISISSKKSDD